jgi:hypothetical protein
MPFDHVKLEGAFRETITSRPYYYQHDTRQLKYTMEYDEYWLVLFRVLSIRYPEKRIFVILPSAYNTGIGFVPPEYEKNMNGNVFFIFSGRDPISYSPSYAELDTYCRPGDIVILTPYVFLGDELVEKHLACKLMSNRPITVHYEDDGHARDVHPQFVTKVSLKFSQLMGTTQLK